MGVHEVRDNFERQASSYDELAPRLVPHYEEQNRLIVELAPFEREAPLSVLDLGCGTGVLAQAVLAAFPRAKVVAIDLAENMLAACRRKLADFEGRLTLRQGDFAAAELGSGYDLVVSGLAIHHLDDDAKQRLYRRIFAALRGGGAFVQRDVVLGASPELTRRYEQLWRAYMIANGQDADMWCARARRYDTPASVEDHLSWLAAAGFAQVACHWRYLGFAIFGGRKSP